MKRSKSDVANSLKLQVEEAGLEVLPVDETEIVFSPKYAGTSERADLVVRLQTLFEEQDEEE